LLFLIEFKMPGLQLFNCDDGVTDGIDDLEVVNDENIGDGDVHRLIKIF
jgi:hypothetical protein